MVGTETREGRESPMNKTTGEAKQKPKVRCSINHLFRWLMFPMKLLSSLQEVWGSVHLSTILPSPPPPPHTYTYTHDPYSSHSILRSWMVFLVGLFLWGLAYLSLLHTKLSFIEGLSWTKWDIRALKTFLVKFTPNFSGIMFIL